MSVNKFKVGDVVKCVDSGAFHNLSLTTGKDYALLDVNFNGEIKVENDKGNCFYYHSYRFELSNGGSANAQQTHKSTKFKEGDMVYLIGFNYFKPCKLLLADSKLSRLKFKIVMSDGNWETFSENGCYKNYGKEPSIVMATEENRLILNKLLGVEYAPVKLTGSDLAKKLLKDKPQTCYVSDDYASSNRRVDLIVKFENDRFITMRGVHWKYAVPCDKHGDVLEYE